jgi:hypothetical protein
MVVLKLLAVTVFASLLASCNPVADIQNLKSDIRLYKKYLSSIPSTDQCRALGTEQNIVCNYRIFVDRHIEGNLFQGHIPPELVADGERACNEIPDRDFECPKAADYIYHVFEFNVVGKHPTVGEPNDFNNVAHSSNLKLGKLDNPVPYSKSKP